MARPRLIENAAEGAQPDGERKALPDAEALDAYSRAVTAVSDRLRPSVPAMTCAELSR